MAKRDNSGEEFSFADFIREQNLRTAQWLADQQKGYRTYSTGSFMLDAAVGEKDPVTGKPGIPERAIVEIFGVNQSFKSGTAEHLLKNVLDADPDNCAVALFAEEPDMDRMERIGIDHDRVMTLFSYDDIDIRKQMAESQLDTIKRAVQDPQVKLVIIDSIKALCSVRQLFDDRGRITDLDDAEALAIRARLFGEFIRDFKQLNKRAILFMTNQTSDRIGVGPGSLLVNPQFNINTPGGRAKEFECTLRILAQSRPLFSGEVHPLTGKELLMGWEVCYRLVKNKYSKNTGNRVAISEFFFESGFNRAKEIFQCAVFLGLIGKKGGGFYDINGTRYRGEDNVIELLQTDTALCTSLEEQITDRSEELFSPPSKGNDESKASIKLA